MSDVTDVINSNSNVRKTAIISEPMKLFTPKFKAYIWAPQKKFWGVRDTHGIARFLKVV